MTKQSYYQTVIQNDSELSVFIPKALNQKLSPAIEYIQPELWANAGIYLPNIANLSPGAEKVTQEVVNARGQAAIYSGNDNEIPFVEVDISEDEYKAVILANAYPLGYFEAQQTALAQSNNQLVSNIRDVRAEATLNTINERSHLLGALGDPARNMFGMLNNPFVHVEDTGFDPFDRATNSIEDVYAWIAGYFSFTTKQNRLKIKPNLLLMSEDLLNEIIVRKNVDNSETIYDLLMRNLGRRGLRRIASINELESDMLEEYGAHTPGENKDRFVYYNLDPNYVERRVSSVGMLAPQLQDFRYKTIVYKCVAEPTVRQPSTMLYVKHPKKT